MSRDQQVTTNENVEYYKQIATTILEQMGGRKFVAMTGAKCLIQFDHKSPNVVFKFDAGFGNFQIVKVIYNEGKDLYEMEFWKTQKDEAATIINEMVYADMLVELFEKHTGLYTSL